MAVITPDLTEAGTRQAIAPGTYAARIKDCEVRTSQAGNDYLNWQLELFGKPEVNNRIVFYRTMIKGGGAFRLAELYKAATGEQLKAGASFDTDALVGREVTTILTEGRDKDGNVSQYPEVKSVVPYKN